MDNNTIDYGKWNIPTSWDEITLKMFEDIERYYSDTDKKFDARQVLHIFTNKTVDEINALPLELTEILMNKLLFLQEKPKDVEASNKVKIDGEEYIINVMEKLKTGEYISIDTIMKGDKYDYASILAVLCRKEGEVYDSKFEAEVFEQRKEMFEKQPITKILPIIGFFLNLYVMLKIPSQLSLEVEAELNRIQKHIETLRKNGDLSILSTKLAMRKLKKLQKSLKSTSQTSSYTSLGWWKKLTWKTKRKNTKK